MRVITSQSPFLLKFYFYMIANIINLKVVFFFFEISFHNELYFLNG